MNAVDKSDQYLKKCNLPRRCLRWWNTLSYLIDMISIINGFILIFCVKLQHQREIPRSTRYSVLELREEVAHQLVDQELYDNPPVYKAT